MWSLPMKYLSRRASEVGDARSVGAYPSISQPRFHYNDSSSEEPTPGSIACCGTRSLVDEPLTSRWRSHVRTVRGSLGLACIY